MPLARISPEVQPESSKKFFGKDYPADMRPVMKGSPVSQPYPAVQGTKQFADDFVKDENGDGGKWHAQMEYDRLRNKLQEEKAEAQTAYEKKEEEMKELEEAQQQEQEAEKKTADAKKKG